MLCDEQRQHLQRSAGAPLLGNLQPSLLLLLLLLAFIKLRVGQYCWALEICFLFFRSRVCRPLKSQKKNVLLLSYPSTFFYNAHFSIFYTQVLPKKKTLSVPRNDGNKKKKRTQGHRKRVQTKQQTKVLLIDQRGGKVVRDGTSHSD